MNFLRFIYYTVAWKKWQTTPQPDHALHRLNCVFFGPSAFCQQISTQTQTSIFQQDQLLDHNQRNPNDSCRGPGQILLSDTLIWSNFAEDEVIWSTKFSEWGEQFYHCLCGQYSCFFSTDHLHITVIPQQIPLPQSEHQSCPKTLKCHISAKITPNTWITKNCLKSDNNS